MPMKTESLKVQLVFTGVAEEIRDTFRDALTVKLESFNLPGVTFMPEERWHEREARSEVEVFIGGVDPSDLSVLSAIVSGAETKFHNVDHGAGIASTVFRVILDARPEVVQEVVNP